jgi:nucleoside-diphosphate-sugar epimerase
VSILLTGSSGFLGKNLIHEISKENLVYTLNRNSGDFVCDLSKDIPQFNIDFDCVIHAAGCAHLVPSNLDDEKLIFNSNICGTINLLKGLEINKIPKRFVLISSVSVYGLEFGLNINENHELLATEPYGLSKIESEKIISQWCTNNNVICTILRLPLVIGKDPIGNLRSMFLAIEKGYYFNIGGGNTKRSMVLASDVAKYILVASRVGGTYNLTDGQNPSFYDLSKKISKMYNKKKVYNIPIFLAYLIAYSGDLFGNLIPLNSLRLKKILSSLTFDDTKAKQFFGWDPQSIIKNDII